MKKCKEVERILADYAYDLLKDEKKKKLIADHLKKCKTCRKQFTQVSIVQNILNQSKPKADNNFSYVLYEAKRREKEAGLLKGIIEFFADLKERWHSLFALKPLIQISSVLIVFAVIGFLFFRQTKDSVYISMAEGDIRVNNTDFFSQMNFKHELKNGMDVKTEKGECAFQVNREKLVIVKPDSEVKLYKKKDIILNLKKGKVLCSVRKMKNKPKMIIKTGIADFKIIGTKFYIEKLDNFIELGVKEGLVEVEYQGKKHYIDKEKLFWIKNNKIALNRLLEMEQKQFDVLQTINFIDDLSAPHFINVAGDSSKVKVFQENKVLGNLPLFKLIEKKQNKKYFIQKDGFVPQQISPQTRLVKAAKITLNKQRIPELMWSCKFPTGIIFKPLHMGDNLIIPGTNGVIYKFNLNEQKIIWKYNTQDSIQSTPIYHKNNIILVSIKGQILNIDYKTGKLIWKLNTGYSDYLSPAVSNDKIYICNNKGYMFCIDVNDGKVIWKQIFERGFITAPLIRDNTLYVGNINGRLYAFDLKKRIIKWHFQIENKVMHAQPVIYEDSIYLGSYNKNLYVLDYKTGKLKWKYKLDSEIATSPVILEELVLVTSGQGTVYALNKKNGELSWSYPTYDRILYKADIIKKKYVLLSNINNNIYLLNKYGLEYLKFKQKFFNYITYKNRILIISDKNYLYSYLITI